MFAVCGPRADQQAGIERIDESGEKLAAHRFRHTFATGLVEAGFSDEQIRAAGGWSDSRMVGRYSARAVVTPPAQVVDLNRWRRGDGPEEVAQGAE